MYPRFGDQTWITPYGLMLVAALVACWLYARHRATAVGIDRSHIALIVPLVFIISASGAKLLPLVSPNDTHIAGELLQADARLRLFGLLIVGLPVLLVYSRLANLSFRGMLDIFALPSLLSLVILRVGCFMAGCCWGDLVFSAGELSAVADTGVRTQVLTLPWLTGGWLFTEVSFPAGSFAYQQHLSIGLIEPGAQSSMPVHPTQAYEIVLLISLLVFLHVFARKQHAPGVVALAALIGYCVLRFFVDYLRADSAIVFGSHTFTQILCVSLLFASPAIYVLLKYRNERAQERC